MKEMSVFDAKTHFSGLIDQVYTLHESVTITRRGVKIVKIIPFESHEKQGVADLLRELSALSEEIGTVGLSLKELQRMKEEGRK